MLPIADRIRFTPSSRNSRGLGMAPTILIVEDNVSNMKLFHDVLSAHGYEPVGAQSGARALEMVREVEPALIVMDVQLPDVSGLDVTRWIRSDPALRHIPIVAVTAFAMKGDSERILAAGCDAYLAKPIGIDQFMRAVETHLRVPAPVIPLET